MNKWIRVNPDFKNIPNEVLATVRNPGLAPLEADKLLKLLTIQVVIVVRIPVIVVNLVSRKTSVKRQTKNAGRVCESQSLIERL